MNQLDFILILPLLYGLVRGLMRGLIGELTSIIAIVAAVVCAKLFAPEVANRFLQFVVLEMPIAEVLAYITVFLVVAISLNILGKLLKKLLHAISLGWLNRLLGAVFGTLKWALIVSVILNGVSLLDDMFGFIQPELKETSLAYEPMKSLASVAWQEVQNIDNVH